MWLELSPSLLASVTQLATLVITAIEPPSLQASMDVMHQSSTPLSIIAFMNDYASWVSMAVER